MIMQTTQIHYKLKVKHSTNLKSHFEMGLHNLIVSLSSYEEMELHNLHYYIGGTW
jgi:hypothetical protein